MNKNPQTSLTAFAVLLGWLLLVPGYVHAGVITGTYYAVGDELRVVDFDGTSFTSSATILSSLVPDWTAMSYDAAAGHMYYAVGDELRVVDFDGTSFTSSATILSSLVPDWTAMSYDAAAGHMYYAVGDELRVVDFDGTSFTSSATILSPLVPDWTAMSLVFAPTKVPEPGTLALACSGLAVIVFGRRRCFR